MKSVVDMDSLIERHDNSGYSGSHWTAGQHWISGRILWRKPVCHRQAFEWSFAERTEVSKLQFSCSCTNLIELLTAIINVSLLHLHPCTGAGCGYKNLHS